MNAASNVAWIILALGGATEALSKDVPPIGEVRVRERTFLVWNSSHMQALKNHFPPAKPQDEDGSPFYLHVAGSIEGFFPRSPGRGNWLAVRILPGYRDEGRGAVGGLWDGPWYLNVFERPPRGKHLNYFTVDDLVTGAEERVEKERLYVRFTVKRDTHEPPLEEWMRGSGQILFPKEGREGRVRWDDAVLLFGIDRGARFIYANVLVDLSTNFSDVTESGEFAQAPRTATLPLLAACDIRGYLGRVFPDNKLILGHDRRIEFFTPETKNFPVGKEVKLHIGFGLDALRLMEVVRLRATSGTFRRDGADVFYKAAKAGRHTLTLEAISGTRWDGKVEYGERRDIEVTVE